MFYASHLTPDGAFIDAIDVTAAEQHDLFYCPCPTCECRFGIRSINSNKRKPTFFKLPSSNHSASCFVPYVKSEDGDNTTYDADDFEPQVLLDKILQSKNNSSDKTVANSGASSHFPKDDETKPIKTIRQLYNICASNNPNMDLNNGLKVKDIFAGRNTSFLYTQYISGLKLVECKFINRYDNEKQLLFFSYPYGENTIILKVSIKNKNDYFSAKRLLWDFNRPVIIYANWNNSTCDIYNSKQLVPLKNS